MFHVGVSWGPGSGVPRRCFMGRVRRWRSTSVFHGIGSTLLFHGVGPCRGPAFHVGVPQVAERAGVAPCGVWRDKSRASGTFRTKMSNISQQNGREG